MQINPNSLGPPKDPLWSRLGMEAGAETLLHDSICDETDAATSPPKVRRGCASVESRCLRFDNPGNRTQETRQLRHKDMCLVLTLGLASASKAPTEKVSNVAVACSQQRIQW